MRLTLLLPLLTALPTLALPITQPQDIALLGMCITGRRGMHGKPTCHNGPGLLTALTGGASPAAAGAAPGSMLRRGEVGTELGVGGLLGNLPILSSLFGMGDQSKKPASGGGSGGGLGGLGLKERAWVEERGEEAGVGDLLGNLPLLSSLFGGGGKGKGKTPSPQGASPMMGPSGRKQHLGGSIGI